MFHPPGTGYGHGAPRRHFRPHSPPGSPEFVSLYGGEDTVAHVLNHRREHKWMLAADMSPRTVTALYPADREANLLFSYVVKRMTRPDLKHFAVPATVRWRATSDDNGRADEAFCFALVRPTPPGDLAKITGVRTDGPLDLRGLRCISVNPLAAYTVEELQSAGIQGDLPLHDQGGV